MKKVLFLIAICSLIFLFIFFRGKSTPREIINKINLHLVDTGIKYSKNYTQVKYIPLPKGYERVVPEKSSFAAYLQNLPLKTENNTVYLYNGNPKGNQGVHFAVIKMDVGNQDLQQCADAVIRLRAEYLFKEKRYDEIHFNFTSGDRIDYMRYAKCESPVEINDNVQFWVSDPRCVQQQTLEDQYSFYPRLREYLDIVFTYAGTLSLSNEMQTINKKDLQIGDVIIEPGNGGPRGHVVIVVDMATNKSGKKIFLLAQSYMPAQEIHILKNPNNAELSPWYEPIFGTSFGTAEWTFNHYFVKRF